MTRLCVRVARQGATELLEVVEMLRATVTELLETATELLRATVTELLGTAAEPLETAAEPLETTTTKRTPTSHPKEAPRDPSHPNPPSP